MGIVWVTTVKFDDLTFSGDLKDRKTQVQEFLNETLSKHQINSLIHRSEQLIIRFIQNLTLQKLENTALFHYPHKIIVLSISFKSSPYDTNEFRL